MEVSSLESWTCSFVQNLVSQSYKERDVASHQYNRTVSLDQSVLNDANTYVYGRSLVQKSTVLGTKATTVIIHY